jgi:hypothetical protein
VVFSSGSIVGFSDTAHLLAGVCRVPGIPRDRVA